MDLKGKRVLVFGSGKSGIGASDLLAKVGAFPVIYDGNAETDKDAVVHKTDGTYPVTVYAGELPKEVQDSLDLVVLSPGVPTDLPLVKSFYEQGLPVWGEVELAYRVGDGEVLAITGTNGKTTTTAAPTTVAPTTEVPTTVAPTTEAPTTVASTTVAPTTEAPTTIAPTTEAPTTMAPTTQSKTSTVAIGEGSDVGKVNRKILNCKNDKDLAGSTFGKLCVKVKKSKKKAISLTWKKIQVAKTYVIYGAKCGTSYKKIATVHSKTFTNKKLKKGTYYKYMVVALNEKGKVVAISKLIHVATKGGKVGNCKKLKVNKSKVNLKQGRKFKLKVKQIAKSKKVKLKKHRKTAFESDNQDVAVVSKKGVITAKKKGKCSVYVYAQNGVYKQVKVTVK